MALLRQAAAKAWKALAVPEAEPPAGLPALRAAIRKHQNCGKKIFPAITRAFLTWQREKMVSNRFSWLACWGMQQLGGILQGCERLVQPCSAAPSSSWWGEKKLKIQFLCCFKSSSIFGFGKNARPGEAVAAGELSLTRAGKGRGC